jgi:hypothetical protein
VTRATRLRPKPEPARDAGAELRDAQMVGEHAATCVSGLFAGVAPKLLHPVPVQLEPFVDVAPALTSRPALWPLVLYFAVFAACIVTATVLWLSLS